MVRIVSLLPSATEIIAALGFQNQLVGRSHECDFPKGVSELPALTSPAFDASGGSADIDFNVKQLVESGLSLYRVDAERLRQLKPDIIVTQNQCEVCAVSEKELEEAISEWSEKTVKIISLQPNSLQDIWEDFRRVARPLNAIDEAERIIKVINEGIQADQVRLKEVGSIPRVLAIEWLDPLMVAGNWMPELIEKAGGQNLLGVAGEHSAWIEWDVVEGIQPELIILLPCGFDIQRTRSEMSLLEKNRIWQNLPPVRQGKVYLLDGNQYFNRPGPRVLESYKILTEIFHPTIFTAQFQGIAWQQY